MTQPQSQPEPESAMPASPVRCAAAFSDLADAARVVDDALARLHPPLAGEPDCVIALATPGLHATISSIVRTIASALPRTSVVGARAPGVCVGPRAGAGQAAMAMLAVRLERGRVRLLREPLGDSAGERTRSEADGRSLRALSRPEPGDAGAFVWCDPHRIAASTVLEQLALEADDPWTLPVAGGLVSSMPADEHALAIIDPDSDHGRDWRGRPRPEPVGSAGVVFSGGLSATHLLSQGCVAFGPSLRVTRAKRNLILELEGHSALEVAAACAGVPSGDLIAGTELHVGRVVGSPGRSPGRGDYVIAPVVHVDARLGGLATSVPFSAGDVIRFHRPDAEIALSDLELLLDAQKLYEPPAGVLFAAPHDWSQRLPPSAAIARAFEPGQSGADRARAGHAIEAGRGSLPVAGLMSSGQIGPLAARPRLTRHSVAALALRAPSADATG